MGSTIDDAVALVAALLALPKLTENEADLSPSIEIVEVIVNRRAKLTPDWSAPLGADSATARN